MKITKKFFLNLTLMTMSFFGLFAATYSWFNAKRQVDPELGSIQVNTSDIESIEYCFIKHDGTYLRNQDDTSTVLNMDPYDPVIVSKNENSHILLQMKLTLHAKFQGIYPFLFLRKKNPLVIPQLPEQISFYRMESIFRFWI